MGNKSVVALVMIPTLTSINRPNIGDYDHPLVKKVIPCWKVGNKYYDLRSNVEVEKKNTDRFEFLEWNVMSGTVFEYKDHSRYLLTRHYGANRELKVIPLEKPEDFHPLSMLLRKAT